MGPWTSITDTTKRGTQQLSWFDTYDQIVNSIINQGMKVYGLINVQAFKGWDPSQYDSDAYI